jgi:hypothetical protein
MPDQFERTRVLIWGKTYPELSAHYTETVCTGGVREDGRPIRLYPVPLRYLVGEQQYRLYDIVDVGIARSSRDNRPESFKVEAQSIQVVGHVDSDPQEWAARRDWIGRDTSWHFDSVEALHTRHRETGLSMGLVRPGEIVSVQIKPKSSTAQAEHEAKWQSITANLELFPREYKSLEFIPVEIRLRWRCAEQCRLCQRKPHDTMVLDWGLIELGRRKQEWALAQQRLEHIANLETHDFKLFMGNFFLHQDNFGVIGLWYPKRSAQRLLL